jgi:hypothetical protein
MMKKGAMYQAGGRVRKYAEGGKISDRSALKGQRETSLQRLQALGMNPAGLGLGVDESPIPIRPRGMFSIDPQRDPRRQREREVSRRRQEADDRVNRESARERQRLANIEAKLEESEENMPGMKKYQEGGRVSRELVPDRGRAKSEIDERESRANREEAGVRGEPLNSSRRELAERSATMLRRNAALERNLLEADNIMRGLRGGDRKMKEGGMVKKAAGGMVKKYQEGGSVSRAAPERIADETAGTGGDYMGMRAPRRGGLRSGRANANRRMEGLRAAEKENRALADTGDMGGYAYKKGGKVMAKAPVKKKAGGMIGRGCK